MPWCEVSVMDQRLEFVRLALQDGANRRELCRRFGISPDVGYKWLARHVGGDAELADRSRRPHASPRRSAAAIEGQVLAIRDAHPAWGARKIVHCLSRDGLVPPAASTVHAILQRHGRIIVPPNGPGQPFTRFEKDTPNALWQMDFKGHIPLADGTPCHPLTMIDDHSRYALRLAACSNQQRMTVQEQLTQTFRRYGLPDALFVDNGPPWGDSSQSRWTGLRVWLLKLGVEVIYARPLHPQSRGKNERFHRTLKAEVLAVRRFNGFTELQRAFDTWRSVYNLERPHEALGMAVPASRYRPSLRSMPERLADIVYAPGDIVRSVSTQRGASISFKGQPWRVPRAFRGEHLAIRPSGIDGQYGVFFGSRQVATIDLTRRKSVSHVSEQVSAMSPG
ncbi:IS481 family transposase [Tardiphaga alba]|uniref:IS481 family transposase n=1 Tax=Tardiphaga alba TaxID=340268 RepID=A0ABX8A679_9BRAD|nr:IS481 family transposase [Tardiphaga alba]QUS38777.1 IS481 family transposase [Tardiphaga alba]QUS39194.1 IS481 family transposase [Tardiphaga alba]